MVTVGFRLDTNEFVDEIKAILHCEASVFSGDERISTTVLREGGTRAVGTKATDDVRGTALAGNIYTGKVKLFGRDTLARYNPSSIYTVSRSNRTLSECCAPPFSLQRRICKKLSNPLQD